jgi:hypothetical protein
MLGVPFVSWKLASDFFGFWEGGDKISSCLSFGPYSVVFIGWKKKQAGRAASIYIPPFCAEEKLAFGTK